MKLLFIEKETDIRAKVLTVHNFPEILSDEDKQGGILVENIPIKDESKGMPQHYINPQTKEQWYEYTELPVDDIALLKEENINLKESLAELAEMVLNITGGM